MTTSTLLRVVAVAIGVAGVIDPAITAMRPVKPEVSVLADDRPPDPSLVDRVAHALEPHFVVVRGPAIGAAAVVSIGFQLPAPASRLAVLPAFAVFPEPRAPFAAVVSMDAPPRAQLQARVPIAVRVHTMAARGKKLTVTLESGGIAVDRAIRDVAGDDTSETIELGLVATASGTASYVVSARVDGAAQSARADFALTAGEPRWAVLFFDRRPSWMSTFVRRAVESDPRFVVTSRVSISRGVAASAGRPPATLASMPSLELFDTVFVGAPEELGEADVAGLEAFMRGRGGTVGLLMDVPSNGRPFQRLAGVSIWSHADRAEPSGEPPASEFLWPATMPLWAEPLVSRGHPSAPTAPTAPAAIWQTAIGRGRLIISGALDAWRYRDRDADGFDRFWRSTVAAAAQATPPSAGDEPARDVAPGLRQPAPDERDLLRAWTSSRGGLAIAESQISTLAPAIERALSPASERRTLRPMRSAWWIVPFALALGSEWWIRRRAGRR